MFPNAGPHVGEFLKELALCGEVADWLASFSQSEDLQHEVDILKSKGVGGDHKLVTVLGDLDAVRGWFSQLGVAELKTNKGYGGN